MLLISHAVGITEKQTPDLGRSAPLLRRLLRPVTHSTKKTPVSGRFILLLRRYSHPLPNYVAARALDASGVELGRSPTVRS